MKEIDYAAPRTVDEAAQLLEEKGERARLLAGGTDIIVQLREHRRECDVLIDAKFIPELNELVYDPQKGLKIGAAVPCYQIYENREIARAYPGLIDAVFIIGGVQIQSRASVGGNLCNASPAADTIPALIVHKGICTIAGPKGTREVPVEDFCTAPGKTVLGRGEFLQHIFLPAPPPRFGAAYMRFIPRNEMDIAVVGAGVSVTLDDSGKKCVDGRVALAAVAPRPLLVKDAAAALTGHEVSDDLLDRVAKVCQAAITPISDMRGDAEYRRHLVGVLTKRAMSIAIDRAKQKPEAQAKV